MKSLDQGSSKKRYFRCPDSLYEKFIEKVRENKEESASAVIRKLIEDYTEKQPTP
ncbi:hypothetical protein SH1V18_03390 [Vallitalea longa]|uniref:Uncharacterized protein n=1 Tax=Vallitalea longa TaxID=2936439 RepID=A0A9W6DER5_9FIRM|nr:hypothetical protein [Vallitalea longa]GKX27859.1 hypothetical protein SH1V18_03390 [Vallitalea longa]